MAFLILLAIFLVAIALAQKYEVFDQIKQNLTGQREQARNAKAKLQRAIPGTQERRRSEYDVDEPPQLPSVDEIVNFLWDLHHDRYVMRRFEDPKQRP